MADYPAKSKKTSPLGDAVAIRTVLPDEERYRDQAWLVAYSGFEGAVFKSTGQVADWPDIPTVIDS